MIRADDKGRWELINTMPYVQHQHTWSPDGKRIVFVNLSDSALYVINAEGSGRRRLINTARGLEAFPAWSPDGKRIAFFRGSASPRSSANTEGESADLYVVNVEGSGRRRLANAAILLEAFPTWSPDAEKIAFFCPATPGSEGTDLCVINADGTEWARHALDSGDYHEIEFVSWGTR